MLALLALPGIALAAEVTDMPPALRGDAAIHYTGAWFAGPLEEGGERVIGARRQSHIGHGMSMSPRRLRPLFIRTESL